MMKRSFLLLAIVPLFAVAQEPNVVEVRGEGDVLIVEDVDQDRDARSPVRESDQPMPIRGVDMANVRNVFGEPHQEHAAVGDPPITRWDYDSFSVFFEYDKVIHSVATE